MSKFITKSQRGVHAFGDINLGPAGGVGGGAYETDTTRTLKSLVIRYGGYIDHIRFVYTEGLSTEIGGQGGDSEYEIVLGSGEHLVGISGRSGGYVDSLSIITNLHTYGVFGGTGGSSDFNIFAPNGYKVIGFFGRSGGYVDSIGLITRHV